jgi:ABC-2 type transport system permease protein
MNKIPIVAVREFIETVKTKTFFFSSVLVPALMLALIFGSQWVAEVAEKEEVPTRSIDVVDQTNGAFDHLAQLVAEYNQEYPQRKIELHRVSGADADVERLRKAVLDGERHAYLILPAAALAVTAPATDSQPGDDAATTTAAGALCELGRKDSNLETQMTIERMVNQAVTALRFERADPPIDLERVTRLQTPVAFRQVDVASGKETTGSELTRFMTPFAFMFLLFMGTMTISQGLLTSVIEEKSSRVVEVLLSAVSPTQLMAGKILGMVGVGAVLLVIWGTVGYGGARARDMAYLVTPQHLTYLVLYFVPGFLLTSAFLAAVGAACNSIKEAQSMAAPLTLLTIVPMMLWWAITQNPTSMLSIVLSYVPPITPFVMILRICADPETPLTEIVATLVLLWVSVLLAIWLAGKIFRVGVLMYGKPPSPKELLRWLRYD